MNIINNLSANNHFAKVTELLKNSSEITIASPFLMPDYSKFLDSNGIKKNANIRIITTLQKNSIEQINKIKSLISFVKHPKISENNINVSISINNKLHGKIYVFNDNNISCGIISSANFTNNGLIGNHEWGVEINDKEILRQIMEDIESTIEVKNITLIELDNLYKAVQNFTENKKIPNQEIELDLIGLLPTTNKLIDLPSNTNYWLKPIGVTENPIQIGQPYSELQRRLQFSKGRPNSVKIGDVLICYGVGSTQILSIYRVASGPIKVTQEEIDKERWLERWPWYVIGENLTPNFGSEWWKYGLNPFRLMDKFLLQSPNSAITTVGGKSLGAINQGKDKLNLNRTFAMFMMNQVVEINRQITGK